VLQTAVPAPAYIQQGGEDDVGLKSNASVASPERNFGTNMCSDVFPIVVRAGAPLVV